MVARALILIAFAAAASALSAYNPSPAEDLLSLGGLQGQYKPIISPVGTYSFCPELFFFGEMTLTWQQFKGNVCRVEFSAVVYSSTENVFPVYKEVVEGMALETYAPTATYPASDSRCIFEFQGQDYMVTGSAVTNIGSSTCAQASVSSSYDGTAHTALLTFAMPADRLVTPIGPMVIQQKSNGDYLFSTAVVYQNLVQAPETTETTTPNVEGSVTDKEHFLYNYKVWILEGTWNAFEQNSANPNGHLEVNLLGAPVSLMRFKPRNAEFYSPQGNTLGGGYVGLDPPTGDINTLFSFKMNEEEFTGRKMLTVSEVLQTPSDTVYEYVLAGPKTKVSKFQKNMVQSWFGGKKQQYVPPSKESNKQYARLPGEKKRRRHRKNKRKYGKKSDNRNNKRFKLA